MHHFGGANFDRLSCIILGHHLGTELRFLVLGRKLRHVGQDSFGFLNVCVAVLLVLFFNLIRDYDPGILLVLHSICLVCNCVGNLVQGLRISGNVEIHAKEPWSRPTFNSKFTLFLLENSLVTFVFKYLVFEGIRYMLMKPLKISKNFLKLYQMHLAILRFGFLITLMLSFLHPRLLLVLSFLLFKEYLHYIETLGFLILIKAHLLRFHPNNCGKGAQIELINIEKLIRDTILVIFVIVLLQQQVTWTCQISAGARIRLKIHKVQESLIELSLPTE